MKELYILMILTYEKERNEKFKEKRDVIRSLRDASDPFGLNEVEFMKNFRLTRALASRLIEDLKPYDKEKTSLPLTLRVLATLNFFGHGSYQKCVGNICHFPMSQSSVSRSIHSVTKLLINAKSNEIRFPTTVEEENATKAGFFKKFDIKSTLGAIDCTHVAIISPPSNNPQQPLNMYMNRKGFYSINVEAVCDDRLVFTFLNTNFPGATHDAGIWTTSDLRVHLMRAHTDRLQSRQEKWLLGDQGYPLEPWLLTPIANACTSKEVKFNKIHASARNTIERAFGVLKSRFRCLMKHRVLHYSHATASQIIESCVILHNIMLKWGAPEIEIDEEFLTESQDNVAAISDSLPYRNEGGRVRSRYVSTL